MELQWQQLEDLCVGATVLGTGGGGNPDVMLQFLERVIGSGKRVELVGLADLSDDALIVCPGSIGSIAPTAADRKRAYMQKYENLLLTDENPSVKSLRALEHYLGKRASAIVPTEMGGYNTGVAALVGALAGIPFVDGDPAGRAVPEVCLSTFGLHGISVAPMALADVWGNVVIGAAVESDQAAEEIARAMSILGGYCELTGRPMSGRQLKDSVVSGSVTKAIAIGKAIRAARQGEASEEDVIRAAGGVKVFRGTVASFEWNDEGGFMWGTYVLEGSEEYRGQQLKVWFKNENLMSWLDGRPYIRCPDLICAIEAHDLAPVVNSRLHPGMELVVFGVSADLKWRTDEGLALFGPRHFGFDLPYVPLEEVVANSI